MQAEKNSLQKENATKGMYFAIGKLQWSLEKQVKWLCVVVQIKWISPYWLYIDNIYFPKDLF